MYFVYGCYWETDPQKTTFNRVFFHGLIKEREGSKNEEVNMSDGEIVDEMGLFSSVREWKWDQENKTLKFLATLCDEPEYHVFYYLTEIAPLLFEGLWEVQGGTKEKARLVISPVSSEFFNYNTIPSSSC